MATATETTTTTMQAGLLQCEMIWIWLMPFWEILSCAREVYRTMFRIFRRPQQRWEFCVPTVKQHSPPFYVPVLCQHWWGWKDNRLKELYGCWIDCCLDSTPDFPNVDRLLSSDAPARELSTFGLVEYGGMSWNFWDHHGSTRCPHVLLPLRSGT